MNNRCSQILNILAKQRRIEVYALSEILGVSQVTVRKDLEYLEGRGLIRREHGCATLDGTGDACGRIAHNYDIKRRIAKAAAETVEEGETVMIESGSCCALLAEELAMAQRDITIITNSVFIVNYLHQAPYVKLILLGGYYQHDSQVLVGPMTGKSAEIFFSDKYFIGTDGYIPNFGFTGRDHLRVQTVAELAENAREVIVLTDAEKFQRKGLLGLVRLEKVSSVYTDDRIPKEAELMLCNNNIKVHKVES